MKTLKLKKPRTSLRKRVDGFGSIVAIMHRQSREMRLIKLRTITTFYDYKTKSGIPVVNGRART